MLLAARSTAPAPSLRGDTPPPLLQADMPEAPPEGLLKASLSLKVKDYAAASK